MAQGIELFERAVADRDRSALLTPMLYADGQAEKIGKALLQRSRIGILLANTRLARRFALRLPLRDTLDVSDRKPLINNAFRYKFRI